MTLHRSLPLVAATALLAGCAHGPRRPVTPPAPAIATIDYETGACFGACPVYRLHVPARGPAMFTGLRFTATSGERQFTPTPAEVANFTAMLAPWRPAGERRITPGQTDCKHAATDMPSVTIRWDAGTARAATLVYYFGCLEPGNQRLANAVGRAPDRLPIAALIGPLP